MRQIRLDTLNFYSDPELATHKGFTGHNQLDGVNLIHMGGRVYDAEIGRFLSADPFVQDSTNLQGLNRYSYVENNPLSYTDPSGYFLKSLFKKIGKAIKNAVSAVVEFERELRRKILRAIGKVEGLSTIISVALNFIPGCQGWCSMAFSAAMTDANGGTIGQMFTGAAIGFVMHGLPGGGGGMVGAITKNMSAMARTGVNLVAGGVSAKAQGGKFIDGVKGAAVGMGLTAVGMGIRESVTYKTDLVSEIGNELRILFSTKPPAHSYTEVEQIGDGAPMTVASPAAIAEPPIYSRQDPWPRSGWEPGLMSASTYQMGAYNIASQERTAVARSVFDTTMIAGVTTPLGGALGVAGRWTLSTPVGRASLFRVMQGYSAAVGEGSAFLQAAGYQIPAQGLRYGGQAEYIIGGGSIPSQVIRPAVNSLVIP